ncbi:MAG: hypothetical protein ACFFBD_17820 [Candidatus Hodarchaeota archaeon]
MITIAVDWLRKFEGTPEQLIAELKGENSNRFKLMASFLLENRVLSLRTTIPPLLAASFAIDDKQFIEKLLHEANMDDIAATVRLLRQNAAGIGLNKRIRKTLQNWMYSLSGERLELEGLSSKGAIREVMDLIHTNPDKFSIKWWQHYIFGKTPPGDSLTAKYLKISSLSPTARSELIRHHTVPWAYLLSRAFRTDLPEDVIEVTIEKAPFMYLIHYLDKLASKNEELDKKLAKALITRETTFNFGLVLKNYLHDSKDLSNTIRAALLDAAQKLLNKSRVPELTPPVFVIGDNSASMRPSIEAAVLMSCILAQKLEGCRLLFFNDQVRDYPAPKNIQGILKALKEIRANSSTAVAAAVGAAALQKARTIILISDGGHNTPSYDYVKDLKSLKVAPSLDDIDFYYLMVSGDPDRVWDAYKGRTGAMTRLIDLKNTRVSFIFGFLKLMLQFFHYDPESDFWDQIEAIKGAFLPETPLPDYLTSKITDQTDRSKQCVICDQNVTKESAILLTCGHRYHENCLKRYWDLLDGERRCVFNCKTPIQGCVECGANLKGTTCEYCGAEYLKL